MVPLQKCGAIRRLSFRSIETARSGRFLASQHKTERTTMVTSRNRALPCQWLALTWVDEDSYTRIFKVTELDIPARVHLQAVKGHLETPKSSLKETPGR